MFPVAKGQPQKRRADLADVVKNLTLLWNKKLDTMGSKVSRVRDVGRLSSGVQSLSLGSGSRLSSSTKDCGPRD